MWYFICIYSFIHSRTSEYRHQQVLACPLYTWLAEPRSEAFRRKFEITKWHTVQWKVCFAKKSSVHTVLLSEEHIYEVRVTVIQSPLTQLCSFLMDLLIAEPLDLTADLHTLNSNMVRQVITQLAPLSLHKAKLGPPLYKSTQFRLSQYQNFDFDNLAGHCCW